MTTTTPSLFQKGIKLLTITCCEFPGDVKRLVRHGSHKQSPRFHRFPFPGSWGPKPSEDNFDFQLCTFAFETCWDMEAHNQRGQEKVFQNSQVPGSLSAFSSDRQNSVLPPSYAPHALPAHSTSGIHSPTQGSGREFVCELSLFRLLTVSLTLSLSL